MTQDPDARRAKLQDLSDADFVARWCDLVGEPPAVLLDDRGAMIALLREAGLEPARRPAGPGRRTAAP